MAKTAEVNSQRIVQAVRRIAATVLQEDSPLDAAKPKARIGKTRGAAYYNSNGGIASGEEVPEEAVDPDKDDDSSTKKRDYQPISDDHQEGDTVDEIEAFDCVTGQKIQLDLAPGEGIEFDPPLGWDDPDQGPVDPTFTEGYFWYFSGYLPQSYSATLTGAKAIVRAEREADGNNVVDNGNNLNVYSASWTFLFTLYPTNAACGGSTEAYCQVTAEDMNPDWPVDSTTNLVLKDGKFSAHQLDPDAATAYKNTPPSSIEVCDGQGNRFSVSALENGRSMITKLNYDGSVPESGHSLVIGRKGKVQNKIGNKVRDGYL